MTVSGERRSTPDVVATVVLSVLTALIAFGAHLAGTVVTG